MTLKQRIKNERKKVSDGELRGNPGYQSLHEELAQWLEELALYRASGLTPADLPRAAELHKADLEGFLAALPCKRQELLEMLSDLVAVGEADSMETYKTGYRNGYRNGRIELLRYILQIPDDTRAEAEAALVGGDGDG